MVKFLVIRFSSIGDIVLTSPVVRMIKHQVENAEVHFLTKEQFGFLVNENPNIDKVHLLKKDWQSLIEELKSENFDHIIDLHNNLRTRRIKSALNIPAFTLDKLNIKKWLLVNLKINKMPEKHIVERYLDTLRLFDVKNDMQGLDYYTEVAYEGEMPKDYIALVIGGTYYTKQIPTDVLEKMIPQLHLPVVLLGGKEDVAKSEVLEKRFPDSLINLCGKISLNQSAYVIKNANLVITSDTGLMHIAAAYKKKIISLWGNTVPELGMTPYLPHSESKIFEINDLKCRPCSKIGFNKCPKKHFDCMNRIDVSEVANYANSIMKGLKVEG